MHKNRKFSKSGFTLLELTIVLLIAGTVATIALPRIDLARVRSDSAYRQIGMTLLAAQRSAVLRQHAVVVAFDTARQRIRVHYDRDNSGAREDGEEVNYVALEEGTVFGRANAPALPMGASAITFQKKQEMLPAVTFQRSGSATENGGFYLTSGRAVQTGQHATDTRAFEIQRATGRTTLYLYASNGWRRSF